MGPLLLFRPVKSQLGIPEKDVQHGRERENVVLFKRFMAPAKTSSYLLF